MNFFQSCCSAQAVESIVSVQQKRVKSLMSFHSNPKQVNNFLSSISLHAELQAFKVFNTHIFQGKVTCSCCNFPIEVVYADGTDVIDAFRDCN